MSDVNKIRKKRDAEQSEARHKTAKIVSSLIPGGSTAYELFTAINRPLYEKRIEEWRTNISLRLHKLEQSKKLNIRHLSENEEFVSLLTKGSLAAIQFHQKEKLESLREIVINSALEISAGTLNYEELNMILRITEQLDSTHFIMLRLFHRPHVELIKMKKKELINSTDRISTLFLGVFSGLNGKIDLLSRMWSELHSFGLVSTSIFTDQFIIIPGTNESNIVTSFGKRFIRMIEAREE